MGNQNQHDPSRLNRRELASKPFEVSIEDRSTLSPSVKAQYVMLVKRNMQCFCDAWLSGIPCREKQPGQPTEYILAIAGALRWRSAKLANARRPPSFLHMGQRAP